MYKNRPDVYRYLMEQRIYTVPVPCGKCLACLINKRRVWTLRILLERSCHEQACFVSLTYAPENLPVSDVSGKIGRGILCLSDLQKFLKRLRKHFSNRKIRYYACGEYGPTGDHMPHYHLILFGLSPDDLDPDWFLFQGRSGPIRKTLIRRTLLYKLWNEYGIVHVGDVSVQSAAYVAGYVTHKITKENDGFTPEFNVSSRRPGLGIEALATIARDLRQVPERDRDVRSPRQIRVDGHLWPFGRYLVQKLRRVSNFSSGDEEYLADIVSSFRSAQLEGLDLATYLCRQDDQKYLNLEKRQQLFKQRSKI